MSSEEARELKQIIEKVDMRTRRIETLLIGDSDFKIRGLVDRVNGHSEKIKEFDKDKTKVVTAATILGAIAGALSTLFHKIFW